mgnify:CR=1 FL=1
MMRCICPEDKCTACEACVVVCPKKCIQRQFNEDRSWKLVIEEDKCIGCRRCEKACPNLTKPYFMRPKSLMQLGEQIFLTYAVCIRRLSIGIL